MTAEAPLLAVSGLRKHFPTRRGLLGRAGPPVRAVEDVSFTLGRGRTLGLVGESGCGKSTAARLILRLIEPDAGEIRLEGRDVRGMTPAEMRACRRDMQLVFQDPFASLNPRLSVADIIAEPLIVHGLGTRAERRELIGHVLRRVGIRPELMDRYPHEFSGGQRQRIGIARALVLRPKLIVADEPVSALDVSIQAQVLNLLMDLQDEFGLSYVVVAHDLAVVEHLSDEVAVMYLGRIVEHASDRDLYREPLHPYTQELLAAIPSGRPGAPRPARQAAAGEVPSALAVPAGCAFHPRCPHVMEICRQVVPAPRAARPGHSVGCHLYADVTVKGAA